MGRKRRNILDVRRPKGQAETYTVPIGLRVKVRRPREKHWRNHGMRTELTGLRPFENGLDRGKDVVFLHAGVFIRVERKVLQGGKGVFREPTETEVCNAGGRSAVAAVDGGPAEGIAQQAAEAIELSDAGDGADSDVPR